MKKIKTTDGMPGLMATTLSDLPDHLRAFAKQAALHGYLLSLDRNGPRSFFHTHRLGFLLGWMQLALSRRNRCPTFVDDLVSSLYVQLRACP